jgi:hypothetical protein
MGRPTWDVERLAEWWTQASQESRWLLLRQAVEGPPTKEVPPLHTLHIAIYLAESAHEEIDRR